MGNRMALKTKPAIAKPRPAVPVTMKAFTPMPTMLSTATARRANLTTNLTTISTMTKTDLPIFPAI